MEGEIDIRRYIRVFLRRKWIFIGVFFGILLFTWVRTILTPKTFVASAKLLVKETSTLLGESQILEEAFNIETNCAILRSRGFAEKVVSCMRDKGIELDFLPLDSAAPDRLLEVTSVLPLKDSNIIQITVRSGSAEESALIVNNIAETFKEYSVEIARAKVTEVRKFIEAQLPEAEQRLREAERELQSFKEEEKLVSVVAGGQSLQNELSNLQSEYSSLLSEISVKETLLVHLREQLREENERLADEIVKIEESSLLNLREQLVILNNRYASYVIAGLDESHPKLVELNKKMEVLKEKLKAKAIAHAEDELLWTTPPLFIEEVSKKIFSERSSLLSLKARRDALEGRIKEYQERIRSFPEKEYKLARLERAYEFNQNIYQRFIDRYEEAKLTEVGEIGNVVVVEWAVPPEFPISPNPVRNMLFAFVFGLGLGIAGILLREYLDTSIKEAEELERLKISLVGTIPEHPDPLIKDSTSPLSEAYKKLRVNLDFSKPGGSKLHTLLVSSCVSQEGKTTIARNLSLIYARAGVKTLLLEGDLRKPSLYKLFKTSNKDISSHPGLSNLLVGDTRKVNTIVRTDIENLWVIPGGHIPPNPGELIDSDAMRSLISELRGEFDFVIIDSPPLGSCADGFLLGNMVEGVILVLELGKTPRDLLLQTISTLKSTGASFLGVVVNKLKRGVYSKYYYKYYYYPKEVRPQT